MGCKASTSWRVLAAVLSAAALMPGLATTAVRAYTLERQPAETQPGDDQDEGRPPAEAAPEEAGPQIEYVPKPLGAIRRPDPWDAAEDARNASRTRPSVAPADDAVICEAGCDGPRGMTVYRKKR
jgi:hypothetical protein